MFVLSGLCGGKSRMLLFDKDEVIKEGLYVRHVTSGTMQAVKTSTLYPMIN
jgi:hypothetical protein